MKPKTIFVSIACFLDPDIVNTINDLFQNAKNPNNVYLGICYQYDKTLEDCLKSFNNHPNIRIHYLDWKQAQGPILARYYCAQLMQEEEYFLQIDCHTRFFPDWDQNLINCYQLCQKSSPKPVISHYPININNMQNPDHLKKIGHIQHFRHLSQNDIKMHGRFIKLPDQPVEAWGLSAAMLFCKTQDIKAVPMDPHLPFGLQAAEQFLYSARLWTSGYNFFTPNQHCLATEYLTNRQRIGVSYRSYHNKQSSLWGRKTWNKVKYLLGLGELKEVCSELQKDIEKYQLGEIRSIDSYFKFVGIDRQIAEIFKK